MKTMVTAGLGLFALTACAASAVPFHAVSPVLAKEVTVPGPDGPLAGTLLDAPRRAPAILLLPGSGPTDRNGDNSLGVKGGVYRQLAEGLNARGIAVLRTDKRGIGGSAKAAADPNHVTIADYVADTRQWVDLLHATHRCVWLAGHSEGGLIALAAASKLDVCGVVLIAAPGRKLDAILHEQLAASLPADMMAATDKAIGSLAAGKTIDPATVPAPVRPLFNTATQAYLIDMMRQDPAAEVAALKVPVLIVQGEADLQVRPADAEALARAQPKAVLKLIPGMNHVFKAAPAGDRTANLQTYGSEAPIVPELIETIAAFVKQAR